MNKIIKDQWNTESKKPIFPPLLKDITTNQADLKVFLLAVIRDGVSNLLASANRLGAGSRALFIVGRSFEMLTAQLIRVYFLVRWVRRYAGPTKLLINIIQFLQGQRVHFGAALAAGDKYARTPGWHVKRADFETALQVLVYGRPFQLARGMVTPKALRPKTVLAALQDLNLVLAVRLAMEPLDTPFGNYSIKNGCAQFVIEHLFEAKMGVGDDTLTGMFYLVDFKFKFPGVQIGVSMKRLEAAANAVAMSRGLARTLSMLLRFALWCKLEMLCNELKCLREGLLSGLIHYRMKKAQLEIRYWGRANLLIIGMARGTAKIEVQWYRAGRLQDHDIEFGQTNISVKSLLEQVFALHARLDLAAVYGGLTDYWNGTSLAPTRVEERVFVKIGHSDVEFGLDKVTGKPLISGELHDRMQFLDEKLLNSRCKPREIVEQLISTHFLVVKDRLGNVARAEGWAVDSFPVQLHVTDAKYMTFTKPGWPSICVLAAILGLKETEVKFWVCKRARANVGSRFKGWQYSQVEEIGISQFKEGCKYKMFEYLAKIMGKAVAVYQVANTLKASGIVCRVPRVCDRLPIAVSVDALRAHMGQLDYIASKIVSLYVPERLKDGAVYVAGQLADPDRIRALATEGTISVFQDGVFNITLDVPQIPWDAASILERIAARFALIREALDVTAVLESRGVDIVSASFDLIQFQYAPGFSACFRRRVVNGKDNGLMLSLGASNAHSHARAFLFSLVSVGSPVLAISQMLDTAALYNSLYNELHHITQRWDGRECQLTVRAVNLTCLEVDIVGGCEDVYLKVEGFFKQPPSVSRHTVLVTGERRRQELAAELDSTGGRCCQLAAVLGFPPLSGLLRDDVLIFGAGAQAISFACSPQSLGEALGVVLRQLRIVHEETALQRRELVDGMLNEFGF